jgi:hypothetical protein
MSIDEAKLDKAISDASKHDDEYLYYLLGSFVVGPGYQTQSAGKVQESGKSFFEKFKSSMRAEVCGPNGPYKALEKGLLAKKDLPKWVAIAILTGVPTLGGITVTYAIAAYTALLITKAGLGAYCAGEKHA